MLKKFGKDIIIYGISSSLAKFVTLFLVPIYTKVFEPEVFGVMDLVTTVMVVVSIFGMLQIESAVSRYYYNEKNIDTRTLMLSTALWTIFLLSLFLSLIVFLFANKLSLFLFSTELYSASIIVGSFSILLGNLSSLFTVIIRFKKRPLIFMFFQLLQIIVTVGLTILFTVSLRIGVVGVFWGQFWGLLVANILMGIYLRKEFIVAWNSLQFKKMMRFSLPLVPSMAGGWVNSYVNRFVILGYLSVAEIGIYSFALKISSVFQLIGSIIRMAWGPFFWETFENNSNHKSVFKSIQKEFSCAVIIFVMLIALFSLEVVSVLSTSQYLPAANLIGFISLALAISNIIMPITGVGPGITKKTEYNTIIYFISLPINIIGLFLLVPRIGLTGVVLSLLLSNIVFLALGWYNSERLYYIGFDVKSMILHLALACTLIVAQTFLDFPFQVKILFALMLFIYLFFRGWKVLKSGII